MRTITGVLMAMALVSGCTQVDENPHWNPQAHYPPWAYDAPFYYRPSEDMKVVEMIETAAGPIPVYYARTEYFFIKHPGGYQVSGEPRVAIWSSLDKGKTWDRVGYYGVEQAYFRYLPEADGQHWIRFVGPGQGVTEVPPGMPHRIYVVDRQPPQVVLTVEPSVWQDREKKIPRIFKVGETVTLNWSVVDENLADGSIKLGTCFAKFPHNLVWSRFPKALPPSGSMQVEIPPEAVRDGGLRFRMEAEDKPGNIGMGLTEILHVEGQAGDLAGPLAKPAGQFEPVHQTQGTPEGKDGWPNTAALWRGGTSRVLNWIPKTVADYKVARLEFSANDGRSWLMVATGLRPNQSVRWTVPMVTSKMCRLRIVGLSDKGEEFMLATSPKFTVDTVMPETEMGPTLIPPPEGEAPAK